MPRSKTGASNSGSKWRSTCSVEKTSDIIEDENFFVDEDKEENRLFSYDNEEITSPDLDKPNFNEYEMKELNSSINDTL